MARFTFSARESSGRMRTGVMDGQSAAAVAQQLEAAGAIPIHITPADEQADASGPWRAPWQRRVRIDELIIFSHQMASLTRAGVPIVRAIRGLSDSMRNPYFSEVLGAIAQELEAGTDVATALRRHSKIFGELYVSVIHVGENIGRLDEAFRRIALYLELDRETGKRVKAATRYPLFVLIAIGIAIAIVNVLVIPAFADAFQRFDADLPWQTRAILGVSGFFVAYGGYLMVALVAAIFGVRHWIRGEQGRYQWDRYKLRLPKLGSIYERINLSRFCRTFSMVMRAGLPVTQGLGVVANAIGNAYMAKSIKGMRQGIERGESITQTARASAMFSPVVIQMIAVGEETGNIDELLEQAGSFYEEEVDYELKTLTDAIEPLLIIAIGAMVLVLALGVFLPLWDLSSVATR